MKYYKIIEAIGIFGLTFFTLYITQNIWALFIGFLFYEIRRGNEQ